MRIPSLDERESAPVRARHACATAWRNAIAEDALAAATSVTAPVSTAERLARMSSVSPCETHRAS
jgi:hypothetical protein